MSVRTRLILAFLVLSVLPLTAVTLYSYGSSVGAFRAAVASESGRMALDLQQRLDVVTADLGRQVGRAWEPNPAPAGEKAESDGHLPGKVVVVERIASLLGDSARLLDRVEFTPTHGEPPPPGSGSVPAPPAPPPAPAAGPPPPPSPPRVEIDMREVMAQVEKDVVAEGLPPEAAAQIRALGERLGPALRHGLTIAGSATGSAAAAAVEAAFESAPREHASWPGRIGARRSLAKPWPYRSCGTARWWGASALSSICRARSRWCSGAPTPRRVRSRSRSTPMEPCTPRARRRRTSSRR